MNHKRLLNALAKVRATVTNEIRWTNEPHTKTMVRFRASKGEEVLCWYAQPHWKTGELEAVSVHSPSPHTDIMTDCFCDTFYHTIKSAAGSMG